MEELLPYYQARYDGEEYRDKVQELDSRRRTAHEAAMASMYSLNKLCEFYELPHMFESYEYREEATEMLVEFFNDFVAAGVFKDRR